MLGGVFKRNRLDKALSAARKARKSEGAKAEQLFDQSYRIFSELVQGDLLQAEAMYRWGVALMDQARQKPDAPGEILLEEAIRRFECCRLLKPEYLAAALDGGVAAMELAKRRGLALEAPLFVVAEQAFHAANGIQPHAAAYNLACLAALKGDQAGCRAALEQARDHGVLPAEAEIASDDDLAGVREQTWFVELLAGLSPKEAVIAEESPVIVEEPQVIIEEPAVMAEASAAAESSSGVSDAAERSSAS